MKLQLKSCLSIDRLRDVLDYNQETGIFFWRVRRGRVRSGSVAGCLTPFGYYVIKVDQVTFFAHRLAWAHVHGKWPTTWLDHVNGNKADNRITNLREATTRQNTANSKLKSNNSSGVRGVHWNKMKGKWHCQIRVKGEKRFLGLFDTKESASKAYQNAAKQVHGEFYRV